MKLETLQQRTNRLSRLLIDTYSTPPERPVLPVDNPGYEQMERVHQQALQLRQLGDNPDPAAVDAIVGENYTKARCSVCGVKTDDIVTIIDADDHSWDHLISNVDICRDCASRALGMFHARQCVD